MKGRGACSSTGGWGSHCPVPVVRSWNSGDRACRTELGRRSLIGERHSRHTFLSKERTDQEPYLLV